MAGFSRDLRELTGTKSVQAIFMTAELQQLRDRFIEVGGQITQSIGLGRVLGQVFAHIYFSPTPQGLNDLTQALEISKGAASMAVRQLMHWGAVQQVWVKGERKDYYEALTDFGSIIRRALLDQIGQRMETADALLTEAERLVPSLQKKAASDAEAFMQERVHKLHAFRNRAQHIWDSSIIKLLLK